MNITEKFNFLLTALSNPSRLQGMAMGQQFPLFIADYPIKEHNRMQKMITNLTIQLQQQGISVKTVNLYDEAVKVLKQNNLDDYLSQEPEIDKKGLLDEFSRILNDDLVKRNPFIKLDKEYDFLFVTDVGAVFPYVRIHNIIENLQNHIQGVKVLVVFFPGEYKRDNNNGSHLSLFSIFDDAYYRAMNIFNITLERKGE